MSAPDTVTGVLRHVFTWPDRVLLRDWSSAVESSPHVEVLAELVQRYVELRRHAPGWSPRRYDRNNHRFIDREAVVALLLDAKRVDDEAKPVKKTRRTGRPRVCCVVCRVRFAADRSTARYCSESCKQKAKRRRKSGSAGGQSASRRAGGPYPHDTLSVQEGASASDRGGAA